MLPTLFTTSDLASEKTLRGCRLCRHRHLLCTRYHDFLSPWTLTEQPEVAQRRSNCTLSTRASSILTRSVVSAYQRRSDTRSSSDLCSLGGSECPHSPVPAPCPVSAMWDTHALIYCNGAAWQWQQQLEQQARLPGLPLLLSKLSRVTPTGGQLTHAASLPPPCALPDAFLGKVRGSAEQWKLVLRRATCDLTEDVIAVCHS